MVATDGRVDLFGRARIYDNTGTLGTTVSLNHTAEGMYSAEHTPVASGYFNIVYEFFMDDVFTISAGYEKQGEILDVSDFRTNILRLLGLAHDNSILDLQGLGSTTTQRMQAQQHLLLLQLTTQVSYLSTRYMLAILQDC
jgi:hypothetical protein